MAEKKSGNESAKAEEREVDETPAQAARRKLFEQSLDSGSK